MPEMHELRGQVLEAFQRALAVLSDSLQQQGEEYTPKQRVDAARVIGFLGNTILDRTDPKLTASQDVHIDVRAWAKELPEGPARLVLQVLDRQIDALEQPKSLPEPADATP